MGSQLLKSKDLPKLPSELMEPYFQRFMSMEMESIALGFTTPQQSKERLKAVESFATYFTGLHCSLAVGNEYHKFCSIPDDDLKVMCENILKTI